MFYTDNIEGIERLREHLPENMQFWNKFGNIEELHFTSELDAETCSYVPCIEMTLTDIKKRYFVTLVLLNVSGQLSFDLTNGFFSGLTIDDQTDFGYEKNCRFRLASIEQDIDCAVYCENIKIVGVHQI